jgi:hypothetical protein
MRKQKYQNGNIHRKLRVPTSERAGKRSNPRGAGRRARAMHNFFFSKISEIPRWSAAWKPCVDFAAAKSTVWLLEFKMKIQGA